MKHPVIDLDSSVEWNEAALHRSVGNSLGNDRLNGKKAEESSHALSDTSIDLFDSPEKPMKVRYDPLPSSSKDSVVVTIDSSPESTTKMKNKKRKHWSSPKKGVTSQMSLDEFIRKSPAKSREFGSPRNGQLPMDLFLKWKDNNKNVRAQGERDRHFSKSISEQSSAIQNKMCRIEASTSIFAKDDDSKYRPAKNKNEEKKKWNLDAKMTSIEDQRSKRDQMMKEILNDSFVEKHRGGNYKKILEDKRSKIKDGDVVRRKDQREQLHGSGCACCDPYYDLLGLSPESKKKRIQQVSRHRYAHEPMPKTPEHYWEVGFPTESEQKRRGLIKIASPRKKVAKKLF